MKVTIYTINDCKFSEAERAYLKQNNIEFEEKNLETNRDFLTEMLAISNNFAGTPVTEIVKDTGEKIVLKGFTAEEFDKALGITSAVVTGQPVAAAAAAPAPMATEPQAQVVPATVEPVQEVSPAVEPTPAVIPPEVPPPAPIVESTPAPMPAGTAMPTASESGPTPIAVESLSQDSADVVSSPSESLMPPMPAAEIPQPMPPQTSEENIGPISLDVTPSPEPTPVAPVPSPMDSMTPPVAAAPNSLDSVLQNLQNQVGQTEQKKDGSAPTM